MPVPLKQTKSQEEVNSLKKKNSGAGQSQYRFYTIYSLGHLRAMEACQHLELMLMVPELHTPYSGHPCKWLDYQAGVQCNRVHFVILHSQQNNNRLEVRNMERIPTLSPENCTTLGKLPKLYSTGVRSLLDWVMGRTEFDSLRKHPACCQAIVSFQQISVEAETEKVKSRNAFISVT